MFAGSGSKIRLEPLTAISGSLEMSSGLPVTLLPSGHMTAISASLPSFASRRSHSSS
jgi:hypothetical protein